MSGLFADLFTLYAAPSGDVTVGLIMSAIQVSALHKKSLLGGPNTGQAAQWLWIGECRLRSRYCTAHVPDSMQLSRPWGAEQQPTTRGVEAATPSDWVVSRCGGGDLGAVWPWLSAVFYWVINLDLLIIIRSCPAVEKREALVNRPSWVFF